MFKRRNKNKNRSFMRKLKKLRKKILKSRESLPNLSPLRSYLLFKNISLRPRSRMRLSMRSIMSLKHSQSPLPQ
jgi:hypothetical protein